MNTIPSIRLLLRYSFVVAFLAGGIAFCCAQKPEEIQSSDDWISGIGMGSTYQQAAKNALDDMINKISVVVESHFEGIVKEANGILEDYVHTVVRTYSTASLQNVHYKVLEETKRGSTVLCYLSRVDLQKRFDDRAELVKAYARNGAIAERSANIADALRNYYWALVLLGSHPDYATITCALDEGGEEVSLKPALYNRINALFSGLNVRVARVESEKEPPLKLITLDITYLGQPVQSFDYIYFTGDAYSSLMSASDGLGVAELYGGAAESADALRIIAEYQYRNKANWEPELIPLLESGSLPVFDKSVFTVSLLPPGISSTTTLTPTPDSTTLSSPASYTPTAGLQVADYSVLLDRILEAITHRQPSSVTSLFTPEGYEIFQQLIGQGEVRILERNPTLNAISLGDEVMVRSVPMLFSYPNNHRKFVEQVVFLFNRENRVCDITYALSDVALRDIESKPAGFGNTQERYQLIRFMEEYKTAYCLKQLDFIESIFAENALIIVGTVLKEDKPIDNIYLSLGKERVQYNRYTKQQYIENLRRLFERNEFVNIQFEENTVQKVNWDDKIFGIQIAQHYYSTHYADKGYLFLMIDLNDTLNPKIYVRTWQPNKNPDGSIYGLEDFHLY